MGAGRLPGTTQARGNGALGVEHPPVGAGTVALIEDPALALALPLRYFETLGVPRLATR